MLLRYMFNGEMDAAQSKTGSEQPCVQDTPPFMNKARER
jgi:hypothetical protein